MRVLTLAILGSFAFSAYAQKCEERSASCGDCTVGTQGEGCVWCLRNDVVLNNAAPGYCVSTDDTSECTDVLGIGETEVTKTETEEEDAVLSVSAVEVKLRTGTTASFDVDLIKIPGPFQLYFLLDLSASMETTVGNITRDAPTIPSAFSDYDDRLKPKPFSFGFGSFVDKAIPPFTASRFGNQIGYYARPTYGFKNELQFTVNGNFFANFLENNVQLSGNTDNPEGGFDAIVQALYCKDKVEWQDQNQNALRMILYATDQTSHVAGDGAQAGLQWPAELKCQNNLFFDPGPECDRKLFPSELMNVFVNYEECVCKAPRQYCVFHDFVHDYPSVDQIGRALRQNDASLGILTVSNDKTQGVREFYKKLSTSLGSQAFLSAAEIDKKSDYNDVIREIWDSAFINKIPEFNPREEENNDFELYYTVSSGAVCQAIGDDKVGQVVMDFKCNFQVIGTTLRTTDTKTVTMTSGAFGQFTLTVIPATCECPNENYFDNLDNNDLCQSGVVNADDDCGNCECTDGATGDNCDCPDNEKFQPCPQTADGKICNEKQTNCECGKCICQKEDLTTNPITKGYSGPECACLDTCIESADEVVCSENGECDCGECKCKPNFGGDKGPKDSYDGRPVNGICECNYGKCKKEASLEECSGRGYCQCDSCLCEPPYYGEFCEKCNPGVGATLDPPVLCGDDGKCGACTFQETDDKEPSKDTWGCECCFSIDSEDKNSGEESLCQWCPESAQCFSRATLASPEGAGICGSPESEVKSSSTEGEGDGENNVIVDETIYIFDNSTQCPPPDPADVVLPVVGSLLGLLFLILLALLLWRLWAHMSDKKEWERYEKDKANSKWQADSNPIFESSVKETENPLFE